MQQIHQNHSHLNNFFQMVVIFMNLIQLIIGLHHGNYSLYKFTSQCVKCFFFLSKLNFSLVLLNFVYLSRIGTRQISLNLFTFQAFIGNAYKHRVYVIFANKFCRHSQKLIGIAYNLNFDYKLPWQVKYINCRQ